MGELNVEFPFDITVYLYTPADTPDALTATAYTTLQDPRRTSQGAPPPPHPRLSQELQDGGEGGADGDPGKGVDQTAGPPRGPLAGAGRLLHPPPLRR